MIAHLKTWHTYFAKSSGLTGFGYACSINSRIFSADKGTTSNDESSEETVKLKNDLEFKAKVNNERILTSDFRKMIMQKTKDNEC